jgi:hypothetical protein
LNAITEIFIGVNHEVLLSVFESWVRPLKWVVRHDRKDDTKSRKTGDTASKLAEKTGGSELLGPIYREFSKN